MGVMLSHEVVGDEQSLPAVSAALALHARDNGAGEYCRRVDGWRQRSGQWRVKEQCMLVRHTAQEVAQELVAILQYGVS